MKFSTKTTPRWSFLVLREIPLPLDASVSNSKGYVFQHLYSDYSLQKQSFHLALAHCDGVALKFFLLKNQLVYGFRIALGAH